LCDHLTVSRRFLSFVAILIVGVLAIPAAGRARFASYAEVRDILAALGELLPADLKAADQRTLEAAWPPWIANHDRDIRQRLQRGDEDTLVNWLMFGTSFTARPRALVASPSAPAASNGSPTGVDSAQIPALIAGRAADLVAALQRPGQDERRLFARAVFERKGYRFDAVEDRARLEQHLLSEVARVAEEQAAYVRETDQVRKLPDVSEQFARRSRLYRDRGLSLDTSLAPGFALEQSLRRILADGSIKPGISRVAVIGPGLDFTDKAAGYDVFSQQTLQPFAVADTLLRLGLISSAAAVEITAFDISPRVHDHLMRARARARSGSPYVLHLPLDLGIAWKPGLVEYWKHAGDRIGLETREAKPAAVGRTVEVRTVRIRPQVALRITPENLNIVAERFDGPPFDLVVATNVFVYYDTLDQCLALANVEAMLRPGGLLLSNHALLELPASRLRSAGYLTVPYSDRPDDGDHVVWYRRSAD
jgi:hypothetical protein